jgi:hypothetical protein
MGTFNIQDDNGEVVLGDSEPEFIVPEGTKTLVYSGQKILKALSLQVHMSYMENPPQRWTMFLKEILKCPK